MFVVVVVVVVAKLSQVQLRIVTQRVDWSLTHYHPHADHETSAAATFLMLTGINSMLFFSTCRM